MRSGLQRLWKGSSITALDFWTGITLNKSIKSLQLKPVRPTPTAGSLLGSADAGGDDMDGFGASHQPGAGGDIIIDDAYSHSSVSRSGRLSWILSRLCGSSSRKCLNGSESRSPASSCLRLTWKLSGDYRIAGGITRKPDHLACSSG
jgi:hypothetical protein